jgi:peptide/nickel transport system substrate-binding protein
MLSGAACSRPTAAPTAIQVAVSQLVRGFKPSYATTFSEWSTGSMVFEPLIQRTQGHAIRPWLATSWTTQDSTVWTFRLKRGVRFHDGREFGSADVIRSWTMLLRDTADTDDPPTAFMLVDGAADVRASRATSVRGLRALDDSTLQVTLLRRDPTFLHGLGSQRLAVTGAASTDWSPVGTGPWRLASGKAGDSTIRLVRFGDYHAGRSAAESLIVRVVHTNDIVEQFARGRIDCVEGLTAGIGARLAVNRSVRLIEQPQVERARVWIALRNPALRDVRVRRALLLALDRQTIVRQLNASNIVITDGVVPPSLLADSTPLTPYAPDSARTLLAAAGFTPERPLTLIVPWIDSTITVSDLNTPLAEYWSAIGINVQAIGAEDFGAPSDRPLSDVEAWVDATGVQTPEEYFNTAAIESPFSAARNSPFWSSDSLRAWYVAARSATDTVRRNTIRAKLARMVYDSMPGIPLFFTGSTNAESTRVSGCAGDGPPFLTSIVRTP